MEKLYLTTGEVAKHFGVHYRTVIRWIQKQTLKAHRLPNSGDYRIAYPDLLAFSKAHNMLDIVEPPHAIDILIIDDDPGYTGALQRLLKPHQLSVQVSNHSFEGSLLLCQLLPRLLILDLNLPGIHGCELLSQIKTVESLAYLKTILISGQDEETLNALVKHGADATLRKPFASEALIETIFQTLNISPSDKGKSNV